MLEEIKILLAHQASQLLYTTPSYHYILLLLFKKSVVKSNASFIFFQYFFFKLEPSSAVITGETILCFNTIY